MSAFLGQPDTVFSPARLAHAVTPDDNNDQPFLCKALYIGAPGAVALKAIDSNEVAIFKALPAGTMLPVRTSRIMATGTTSTSIVALG